MRVAAMSTTGLEPPGVGTKGSRRKSAPDAKSNRLYAELKVSQCNADWDKQLTLVRCGDGGWEEDTSVVVCRCGQSIPSQFIRQTYRFSLSSAFLHSTIASVWLRSQCVMVTLSIATRTNDDILCLTSPCMNT